MDRWMDYETAGPLHSYIKGPPPASYSPVHSYRLVCFQDFYDNRYLFLCRLREMKKKKKNKVKMSIVSTDRASESVSDTPPVTQRCRIF